MVLDFRFGHRKCPNRERGKGHFHLLKESFDMSSHPGSIITKIDSVLTKMEIIAGPGETETQGAGNATWVEGGLYLKCYQ